MHLTRYRWNFSAIFYGIILSNPVAYLGRARQRRNHGKIVPDYSAFWKRKSIGKPNRAPLQLPIRIAERNRAFKLAGRIQDVNLA
jgi:hypothetical protein